MIEVPPVEIQAPVTFRRGVCISVEAPCFTLDPPKSKTHKFHKGRVRYYMQSHVRKAIDPDMNMSLREIRDGVKTSDRIALSMAVYGLGVLFIFSQYL